jgi:UMP-CMP kinase
MNERLGFKHLSAGGLLREERKRPESKHGELIEYHLVNGKIVPSKITISLLEA